MKCNCIRDMEAKIGPRVREPDFQGKRPKNANLVEVRASNLMMSFSSGKWMLMVPFTVEWEMASGKSKETTINVSASHCPFCGMPLKEDDEKA